MTREREREIDIHAPEEFEHTIPANERPQTHAFGRAATGIDKLVRYFV